MIFGEKGIIHMPSSCNRMPNSVRMDFRRRGLAVFGKRMGEARGRPSGGAEARSSL